MVRRISLADAQQLLQSQSAFHVRNNSNGVPNGSTTWGGYSTFAEFVTSIVQGGNYDLALTADYGTNAACTGPGDPTEAKAWVAAAVTAGITSAT